ncbi:hypothetical protein K458DRAFT_310595 [Lentithecium fluviatile CBS 122367]|uniref:Uncharacterized protein n=1 Tax=Lentithecium fluviatile CBS 122367 TaxID=1168545 RepID=A0A6G1IS69_9PLEO|nr:hypothetical protein K458DRAFT_310595 [Lentithecium fluviatile CBS 122367]
MRFLRTLVSNWTSRVPTRRFAQVHDVQIKLERAKPSTNPTTAASHTTMERNVFQKPLSIHGTRPLTGYMRTGYCEAPRSDAGNHSVAGIVTDDFLDFSAAWGNDLRQAGLTDGCKWCLCVSRWKEVFDARTGDIDRKVPKVVLAATNERALEGVRMEDLKKFAVDGHWN